MSLFQTLYPNAGSYSASTNADKVRGSLQALRENIAMQGMAPGFEIAATGDRTYNADNTLASVIFKELLGVATGDGRGSGTRYFCRLTFTYTTGLLTKVRYELSTDSGSTYSNWVDAGGNSYNNLAYTAAGLLDTSLWGTS